MSPGARHYGWAGQGVKGNWQRRVKRRRQERVDKSGRGEESAKSALRDREMERVALR